MDHQQRMDITRKLLPVIRSLQLRPGAWVPFSAVSTPLALAGVNHREYGCSKLRTFLFQFQDILEFLDKRADGKPPVCYVRPRSGLAAPAAVPGAPDRDAQLFSWASIPAAQLRALAELAVEEPWSFGCVQTQKELPILRAYLSGTFRRLCREDKVRFAVDPARGEEYAAFHTGLADRNYDPIYALFRHDVRYGTQYWYLLAFVVAGEDLGKKLVSLFNPLPERADYFGGKPENRFYDASSGELLCGTTHILTERMYRLPLGFLKEHCPPEVLTADGVSIDEIYSAPFAPVKQRHFLKLGKQLRQSPKAFNRLRNRFEDAVELAQKQAVWNEQTAVPMYDAVKDQVFLLLPLALADENVTDLALVVERQPSGAYQGQTVLTLDFAYSASRCIRPPGSAWLSAGSQEPFLGKSDAGERASVG